MVGHACGVKDPFSREVIKYYEGTVFTRCFPTRPSVFNRVASRFDYVRRISNQRCCASLAEFDV